MRSLITIALGLLLLVSAAAAQGNNNAAIVTVSTEIDGMLITGADTIQISDIDANLLGNNILADQLVDLEIEDSSLVGLGNGKTGAKQAADLMLNDTGNANIDLQAITLAQGGNDLTIGNLTQIAAQEANVVGSDNFVDQNATADIGVFEVDETGTILGSPNFVTNSDLLQVSVLDATVTGNVNNALQESDQFITDNNLVNSKLYEQIGINANVLGNENNLGLVPTSAQTAVQTADANDMTASVSNQMIGLDEQITGNLNDVVQFGETDFFDNLMTTSTSIQSITEKVKELGNGNFVDQFALLNNSVNTVVGGHLVQETEIETNI